MALSAGEEAVLQLALAGEGEVFRLLREQVKTLPEAGERRTRLGLGRSRWHRQPDYMLSFEVDEEPALSIGERSGFTGFYDVVVFVGDNAVSAYVGVDRGFLRFVAFESHERVRIRSPLPAFDRWGYKQCEHWDSYCARLHSAALGQARVAIEVDERYPANTTPRRDPPPWLPGVGVTPGPPPDERALAVLRTAMPRLPGDVFSFLEWADGGVVGDFTLFGAAAYDALDVDAPGMSLVAVAADAAGDLVALDLGEEARPGPDACAVYLLTHDPPAIERLAASFAEWVGQAAS